MAVEVATPWSTTTLLSVKNSSTKCTCVKSVLYTVIMICILTNDESTSASSYVITVNSKFAGSGLDNSLSALKSHDSFRHLHILAAGVDLPIGGIGRADTVGSALLYSTLVIVFCNCMP